MLLGCTEVFWFKFAQFCYTQTMQFIAVGNSGVLWLQADVMLFPESAASVIHVQLTSVVMYCDMMKTTQV